MKTNATKTHIPASQHFLQDVNALPSSFGQGILTLQEWRNSETQVCQTQSTVLKTHEEFD